MPQTPNHSYNVPNEGDTDWHLPLNDNFQQYDIDIELRDTFSNLSNYQPRAGAKYLATDTGAVYLGDGSSWTWLRPTGDVPTLQAINATDGENLGVGSLRRDVPLDVAGGNNWNLANSDGDVRIGDATNRVTIGVPLGGAGAGQSSIWAKGENDQLRLGTESTGDTLVIDGNDEVVTVGRPDTGQVTDAEEFGIRSNRNAFGGMYVDTASLDGKPFYGYSLDGDEHAWTYFDGQDGRWKLSINYDTVVEIDGNGNIFADGDKNFVESVDTDEGEREVVYTASEAPTPHTEISGVAELEDGRAEVDLPDHFGWVTTDDEPIVVQITPYGGSAGTRVVERSTDRIVVEDLDGEGDYEFAYTIKGTRDGHADKEVVREPSTDAVPGDAGPTPADD